MQRAGGRAGGRGVWGGWVGGGGGGEGGWGGVGWKGGRAVGLRWAPIMICAQGNSPPPACLGWLPLTLCPKSYPSLSSTCATARPDRVYGSSGAPASAGCEPLCGIHLHSFEHHAAPQRRQLLARILFALYVTNDIDRAARECDACDAERCEWAYGQRRRSTTSA